jgi:hypothetical protein
VSKFIVSGVIRNKQSLFISSCGPTDDSGSSNSGLDDGDKRSQLALKDTIEVI